MKSFFAAGGDVPWWISGLSLFMGFFSAGTFVVWGSIAYSYGWVAITIKLTLSLAGFLVGAFLAPRWKNTNVLTAAEYITNRLGLKVQKAYTYIFLFISLFTTGAFLYPVAKIVEVTTGFPLQSSILLLGAICIFYVTVGGLRAVVVTEIQPISGRVKPTTMRPKITSDFGFSSPTTYSSVTLHFIFVNSLLIHQRCHKSIACNIYNSS
jgi:Na+/proline symporter